MVRELLEDDEIQEKGFRSMQFDKRKTLDKQHILAKLYLNTSVQLAWNFWLPPSCPWHIRLLLTLAFTPLPQSFCFVRQNYRGAKLTYSPKETLARYPRWGK